MLRAILLLAAAATLSAQSIEGIWQGTLQAGPTSLRLALHIQPAPSGGLTSTLDSLDQGARGIPVQTTTFSARKLHLELPNLGASFDGTLSADGSRIEGTFTQGVAMPLTLKRVERIEERKRPQTPKPPFPYDAVDVSYETKDGVKLAGTLTFPKQRPAPAALLITGSGPQDRDETLFDHKPFAVLADSLTRRGIAVLRVDDRGVGGSGGKSARLTVAGMAADVLAGVAYLKGRKEIDPARIGLIGHSEGGIVGPIAASESRDVASVVMLAGTGITGEEVMRIQAESILRAEGAPASAVAENRAIQKLLFDALRGDSDEQVAIARARAAWQKHKLDGETTVMTSPEDSLEAALDRGAKIVELRPGIYRGLRVRTAGVTIRAATKWKAVVLGSEQHGVSIEAPGVTIDGLEVTGSRIDGIKGSADGVTIRNCWVHNNAAQGIAIHGKKRWRIERNLIEFNGQHPQLQHGIYADGEGGVVNANVVRRNSGHGVQLYPAANEVTVTNNLVHGHSKKGGIVLAASVGHTVIANNTIADNAYGVRLMGGSGQVIANNIIAGPDPVSKDADAGQPVLRSNLLDDPHFIDRTREIYFLAPGSPAIGKAPAEDAPASDFWGRGRPADLGAFPFVAALAETTSRAAWHNGWPYRFSATDPRMEMPDLWTTP